jgi:tetratricopeptide (TPR) repeat protein
MSKKPVQIGKPRKPLKKERQIACEVLAPLIRKERFDALTLGQFQELKTFIRVANQGYGICICNIPKLREDLISTLTEDLMVDGIGIYQVKLQAEDQSMGAKIRILLKSEEFLKFKENYQKVVLNIFGLDETIEEAEKKFDRRPTSLQGINQQRDYLRTLPFPLLIWVPEWLAARFPEFAPDFWVARSVVFECLTPSETMKQSISQLTGAEVTYKDVNEAKRKMRIYDKLIKSSEDRSIKAFSLLNLGVLKQATGNYAEAENLYRESLKIAKEGGNKSGIAKSFHQLGNIKYVTGDYAEAEKLYRQSLKIMEELGDKSGISGSLHQLGNIKYVTGDYAEAEKLYRQSLKIKEELGDKLGISGSLHQLGAIKQHIGDYSEAENLYRQSLKMKEELGDKSGIAKTLHQLGMIKQHRGEYKEAEKLYRESMKIKEGLGDKSGIAGTLYQLGKIYFDRQNYQSALHNLLITAEIAKKLQHPNLPLALNMIEKVKEKLGETKFQELYQKVQSQMKKA